MWILLSWAAATPLDIDADTLDTATTACLAGDASACVQLIDANAQAWAASVWGQVAGTDTIDGRRWSAHKALVEAGCQARSAELCWVADRDFDRMCRIDVQYCPGGVPPKPRPVKSACLDEAVNTCPEAGSLTLLARPGPDPFPLAEGWAGFGSGRLFPRDVRPGLLVDGADHAEALGERGFVFVGKRIDHDAARPMSVSFLTAKGWADVSLDLDGEGVCGVLSADDEAALVRVSSKGRCAFSWGARWVYPDGRVEDAGERITDVAGPWTLRYLPESHGYVRQKRGGKDEVVPFEGRVNIARISPDGHVAGYAGGWQIWNGDSFAVAPVHASERADWGGGQLVVLQNDFVVKIALDGSIAGVWDLPEAMEHFRAHPDGQSFWGKSYYGVESIHGFDGPVSVGKIPTYVAEAPPHRLAWNVEPAAEASTLTVSLDGAPVVGAFAMGQYTGADGRFTTTRKIRSWPSDCAARVDGICRYGLVDLKAGTIDIAPVVTGTFPDGHSRDIRPQSGKVRLGFDLGDGEVGFVAQGGEGAFLTEGTGEANPATPTHKEHIPTVEPVYEGVISNGTVTWTAHPMQGVQVLDEAGLPLAGASVSSALGRATTGLDGRAELRDGAREPLKGASWVVDVLGPDDGVVRFTRPLPEAAVAVGDSVDSLTELYGLWRDALPTDEQPTDLPRMWAYTPFQSPPVELVGRTAMVHEDRRLTVLDANHLVSDQYWHRSRPAPRAFERVPPPKKAKNTKDRFTGVFGWRAGDRVERTVKNSGPATVDVGTVSATDDGFAIDWKVTKLGGYLPQDARHVEVHRDGWFAGVGPDDLGVLGEQLYETGAGRLAFIMGQDSRKKREWPFRAARDWHALVQVLVGRQLERDVTVTELHLDHEDEPTRVAMTYRGRVECSLGRCARIELQIGEAKDARYVDLQVEASTLRPVRREVVEGSSTEVETWVWSR